MSRSLHWLLAVAVFVAGGALVACGRAESRLPEGAALDHHENVGASEEYSSATLYGYMNGGAEVFLEYGFSGLSVRRYRGDGRERTVELFTMTDARAATGMYSYARRAGTEREIAPGCHGVVTPAEVRLVRGRSFVVCRSDDPMADDDGLAGLCAAVAEGLDGPCGLASLFTGMPVDGRVAGSEVHLAGTLALNIRPWLSTIPRDGFDEGWLARYDIAGGAAELLRARYTTPAEARACVAALAQLEGDGQVSCASGPVVTVVHSAGASAAQLETLCRSAVSGRDEVQAEPVPR